MERKKPYRFVGSGNEFARDNNTSSLIPPVVTAGVEKCRELLFAPPTEGFKNKLRSLPAVGGSFAALI